MSCFFELTNPYDPSNHAMNVAFTGYANHQQEVEKTINAILQKAHDEDLEGEVEFTFDCDDYFSEDDIEYIRRQVEIRY